MRKGDIVICVDNFKVNGPDIIGLTIGKIYKIQYVEDNPTIKTEGLLSVINDIGETVLYYQGRFKPLREHNLEKLNI